LKFIVIVKLLQPCMAASTQLKFVYHVKLKWSLCPHNPGIKWNFLQYKMSIGLCQIYIGEKKVKSFIFYRYFKIGHIEWDKNKNFKGFIYMDFKNTDGQSRLPHLIFFFKKCPIGFFFKLCWKKNHFGWKWEKNFSSVQKF